MAQKGRGHLKFRRRRRRRGWGQEKKILHPHIFYDHSFIGQKMSLKIL